ncbi:MAG: 1,4-beta-xylanase [Gammaproteobacteria bacterium]
MKWTEKQSNTWYSQQPWLVGCNFLPSSAINQLEMFQEDTFDQKTIERELDWAKDLGFNSLRVYLHDLLWSEKEKFKKTFEKFLNICNEREIKPIVVLFDDCHRPYPKIGKQPIPVRGVHNSGWKQSPGMELVNQVAEDEIDAKELNRLKEFIQGILVDYSNDERILMWDIYNEPGQFGLGDKSLGLLKLCWEWAHEIRPSQPLTSCLDGAIGDEILKLNGENSDVITFHTYEAEKLDPTIQRLKEFKRPIMCTEYMAREFGTTFEFSLPIFKKENIGCYNWGLVAGKSQTHFGWSTILELQKRKKNGDFLNDLDEIPEPEEWFHDIFRKDGSPYKESEINFIKQILKF